MSSAVGSPSGVYRTPSVLLRPLVPHPHSCFWGPFRMTRMSLFTHVMSWIDQDGKFINYSIQTGAIFLIRRSTSLTLCHDAHCGNGSLSAKRVFLWHFLSDKICLGLLFLGKLILQLLGVVLTCFGHFSFFSSNCSLDRKHVKICLHTINRW